MHMTLRVCPIVLLMAYTASDIYAAALLYFFAQAARRQTYYVFGPVQADSSVWYQEPSCVWLPEKHSHISRMVPGGHGHLHYQTACFGPHEVLTMDR